MFMVWLLDQYDRDDEIGALVRVINKDYNNGCLTNLSSVGAIFDHFGEYHPKAFEEVKEYLATSMDLYIQQNKKWENYTMAKRADNREWKATRPSEGAPTSDWKNWNAGNPNRGIRASAVNASLSRKNVKQSTQFEANTEGRAQEVSKWQSDRPVSGAHVATTKAGAEERRNKMKAWGIKNPNRKDNAQRTVDAGKQARAEAIKAKKQMSKKKSK